MLPQNTNYVYDPQNLLTQQNQQNLLTQQTLQNQQNLVNQHSHVITNTQTHQTQNLPDIGQQVLVNQNMAPQNGTSNLTLTSGPQSQNFESVQILNGGNQQVIPTTLMTNSNGASNFEIIGNTNGGAQISSGNLTNFGAQTLQTQATAPTILTPNQANIENEIQNNSVISNSVIDLSGASQQTVSLAPVRKIRIHDIIYKHRRYYRTIFHLSSSLNIKNITSNK